MSSRSGISLRRRAREVPQHEVLGRDFLGPPRPDHELGTVFPVSVTGSRGRGVFRAGRRPHIPVAAPSTEVTRAFEFVTDHPGVVHVDQTTRSAKSSQPLVRRVAWMVAVPLTVTPALAGAAPPTLPPPATAPEGDAHDEAAAPQPPSEEAVERAPPPAPPQPTVVRDDALALTGDSLWNGIIGHRVRLEVRTEHENAFVEGELVAQSRHELAVAMGTEGSVASVRKRDVVGMLVDPPGDGKTPAPGNNGNGLLIGGGFTIGVGFPLLALGAAFGGYYQSPGFGLSFGLPGALLLAGGIPMVIIGAKRHREHRKNYGFAQVTPNVRVGRQGAVGGVSLRF